MSDSIQTILANTEALSVLSEEATDYLGRKLEFDPSKEQFVDKKEANNLLTREYRKPIVVPSDV